MKNNEKSKGITYSKAVNVLKLLVGIPEDIKEIFVPQTEEELLEFEINISNFQVRAQEREKVMMLQKQHDLPLRPNQSLKDVAIKIRIQRLIKDQKYRRDQNI